MMRRQIGYIHKKYPFFESILMLFFGIFIDRFLNKFLDMIFLCPWYRIHSLYFLVITLFLLVIYYRYFCSFQIMKDERLSGTLKESYTLRMKNILEKEGMNDKDMLELKRKKKLLKESLDILTSDGRTV